MASTGIVALGIIVVVGAAAVVTKPSADSAAPEIIRTLGATMLDAAGSDMNDQARATANERIEATATRCEEDLEECAAGMRSDESVTESDFFVARMVSGEGPNGASVSCYGAFGSWFCSAELPES